MLMKLMPFFDIATCLIVFLHLTFGMFSAATVLYGAFYLIIKGLVFSLSKDFASMVDLFCGLYILTIVFAGSSFMLLNIFIFVWLLQKGLFGMMA